MFKLFYKTLMYSFLWIILLANIFLFFQIASPLNLIGEQIEPNTYFGVSSLIEMFEHLPNTPLGRVTDKLQLVYNKLFNFSAKFLNDQWINSIESFQRAFDSSSDLEGIGRVIAFLTGLFSMIGSFFTSVFSFIVGLAGVVVFIAYLVFFLANLLSFIIYMVQGMFARGVPSYPSMDIEPYILHLVNSVLTSLRACC